MYANGTQYIFLALSYPLVMASAAHLYLPVFWKLKVSTSYEVRTNSLAAIFNQSTAGLNILSHNSKLFPDERKLFPSKKGNI